MDERIACSYIRLSEEDSCKEKREYSNSIINQMQYIEEYAKTHNIILTKNYIDDGYTGINYVRPGFEEMKKDIEENRISIVITKDFSRLGREFCDTAYYITRYFPKRNVRYIAINDNYDSSNSDNPYNDILVGVKAIINDKYIKDTSSKIKEVKMQKTKKGFYIGALAPYGYKRRKVFEDSSKLVTEAGQGEGLRNKRRKVFEDSSKLVTEDAREDGSRNKKIRENNKITLEVDGNVASIVKRIFTDIANGTPSKEVAYKLNKDEILTPMQYLNMVRSKNKRYSNKWNSGIIYRIIRNRTYTGDNVIRKSIKTNYKNPKRSHIYIQDREIMEDTHPLIIEKELFDRANIHLRTNKRKTNRLKNYDNALNGLITCSECGSKMRVYGRLRESGNVYFFYCCGNYKKGCNNNRKISENVLKNIVYNNLISIIQEFVNEKEIVEQIVKNRVKKERAENQIKNLKTNIELINMEVRNLYLKKTSRRNFFRSIYEKKKKCKYNKRRV